MLTRRAFLSAAAGAAAASLVRPVWAQSAGDLALQAQVEAIIRRHGFPSHHVGVAFGPADPQAPLRCAVNLDRLYVPASTAKAPTALAALEVLGPEHRFETKLVSAGRIANGTLIGDLHLVGGGDPLLDNEGLAELAVALRAAGVLKVQGRFLYDAGALPERWAIHEQQPVAATYNPGVSALSLNHNRFEVAWSVQPTKPPRVNLAAIGVADKRRVTLDGVILDLGPQAPKATASYHAPDPGAPRRDRWTISPRANAKTGGFALPVHEPAYVCAAAFRRIAADVGVTLGAPLAAPASSTAQILARRWSPPLVEILRGMLKYSNNLAAELIGHSAMRVLLGRTPTVEEAAALQDQAMRRYAPRLDWSRYAPRSHSGLTPDGRASARHFIELLRAVNDHSFSGVSLFDVLPDVGAKLADPERKGPPQPPAAQVRAKSGTMNFAKGLVGYLAAPGRPRAAFTIFITDLEARGAADPELDEAAAEGHGAGHGGAWLGRARAVIGETTRLFAAHAAT